MHALITGFDPFDGATSNPSELLVRRLADQLPEVRGATRAGRTSEQRTPDDGARSTPGFDTFDFLILPTVYDDAAARILAAIDGGHPDLVLMFGLAARATGLRLERFALNVCDSDRPDNAGDIRCARPIAADGPQAHATTIDVSRIAGLCAAESTLPVAVSNHAGTFVCNFVYYSVLHRLSQPDAAARALFVHVPSLPAGDEAAGLDALGAAARRLIGFLADD